MQVGGDCCREYLAFSFLCARSLRWNSGWLVYGTGVFGVGILGVGALFVCTFVERVWACGFLGFGYLLQD